MSLTAAAILLLGEMGLTLEQVARVVEANAPVDPHAGLTPRQARNRRYYEAQQRLKASEKRLDPAVADEGGSRLKTSENVLNASYSDGSEPQKEIPPKPPKEKLQPPSTVRASLFPVEPPQPVAKPKRPPRPKSTRCPEHWSPDPSVFAAGAKVGFSPAEIETELESLRDFQFGRAQEDWNAVARNWLRNSAKWRRTHVGRLPAGGSGRQAAFAEKLGDVGRALAVSGSGGADGG